GPPRTACCAHCGLLYLGQLAEQEAVPSALARDFLYGRMVNVQSAFFVVQSAVEVCCVPSTLCFATAEDATRFQQGFGGEVLTYAEAIAFLEQRHQGCHSCASSVTTNTTNK
ncbi:MAG: nitrous oxide reductase accessory protein NosL, partial [Anaerolineales bacterium]|nr:nitrous oxide reductase accessory protein NosL [Anaerolineales bacterium]